MVNTENFNTFKGLEGFVKICRLNPATGETVLLVDKKNMILKGGAKLIARALSGDATAGIWGMYIGYNNSANNDFLKPTIDVDYTARFDTFAAPFGYLREPLTFSPSFTSSAGYIDNTVLFSTMITSATSAGGAEFNTSSQFYEVALISAQSSDNPTQDTVFSRTNFNPIVYNPTYNFTITWGVRILLP